MRPARVTNKEANYGFDFRNKITSGFVYKFFERIGAQGTHLLVSIVLARILLPEDYGNVSLTTIIVSILDVFVTNGFGNSLIANKNSNQTDFSTCFYFELFFSFAVYSVVYILAPSIANYFNNEQLRIILRVMAIRIPISAINTIQHAYIAKHLMFKTFFYATLAGTVVSGVVAIIMAYSGFGIWALVEQYLGNIIIDTVVLSIIVKWVPSIEFSFSSLKKTISYGWKILAVGLVDKTYSHLRSFVIGKRYSSSALAFYNKGNQFPTLISGVIEPTINGVLFPALSIENDNVKQMKTITRRVIKLSSYIIFPTMIGLIVVAEPAVRLVLGNKWLPSVKYLQICCVAQLLRPLQFINNCVIKASGRSALLLKLDIIKKTIGIALLIFSAQFGVTCIAISLVVTNCISTVVNIIPNKQILQYSFTQQFSDVGTSFITSLMMGMVIYCVSFLTLNYIFKLIIQIIIGIFLYIILSVITKNESYLYLINTLKYYIDKRH